MPPAMKSQPLTIDSADMLGIAIRLQRKNLKLTQQTVADRADVERTVVSQLEQGLGDTAHFRVVLLVVHALDMDVEVRSRRWTHDGGNPLDLATSVADIGLTPDALACLRAADIHEVGQLGSASELIQRPEFSKGTELYQIVCVLNRHGLSLPTHRRQRIPGDREREMFRLRVVEGLTLQEVAERVGVKSERVRQLLNFYFRLTGTPPAAKEHKRAATTKRRAEDLAIAQSVQAELIGAWRTGQRTRDLAGWFDVSLASVEEVIQVAATDLDRKARVRALGNQRRRKGRWPTQ
jgi:transcriptional regulator with XRE-family HTH domain